MIDWVLFGLAALAGWGVYQWRQARRRARERELYIDYATPRANVTARFLRAGDYPPLTADEGRMIANVWAAADIAWPHYAEALRADVVVWLVRAPDQCVAWRGWPGVPWRGIPELNRIPARNPLDGYGGMCWRPTREIWVATFIAGRDPARLLGHELAHLAADTHDHDAVPFRLAEESLYEELALRGAA